MGCWGISETKINIILLVSFAVLTFILGTASAVQLELPIDNVVKAGSPNYVLTNSNLIGTRTSYTNPAAADMDADGDYDMIVGLTNGLLEYWRNDGNNTNATWVLANGSLVGDYSDRSSPTLTDFDGDGDFDMIVGYSDSYARYFENTGSPSSPTFTFIRNIISIGSYTNPTAIDYNRDGNMDLYYGYSSSAMYRLKNDVSESSFDFRDFAISNVGTYSTIDFADIDADGDSDAFVGDYEGRVWLFKNLGGLSSEALTMTNKDFWDSGSVLFDVGARAAPALADLDSDGDLDMLVGRIDGTFVYRRNDGTARNAFWTPVSGFLTADAGDWAVPTLSDLDGDNDKDLVVGNAAGFISYYENTGTSQSANFVLSGASLVGDIGDYASPSFADFDNDADFDLAIGRSDGVILFYNNTGTNVSFVFTAAGNILNDYIDYIAPAFADLDGDGDLDLGAGSGDIGGWISIIENKGSSSAFRFSNIRTFWFDASGRSVTADFVDFDKDGDQDMFFGQEDGHVYYQRNDGNATKPAWTYVRNFIGDWGSWTDISVGDLNDDGETDFILGRENDNVFRFFKNDVKDSGFNFVQNSSNLVGDIGSYSQPEFADMDADGDLDALVGAEDGRVRYFRNDGTNQTPNFVAQSDPISDQGDHSSFGIGDLDADGDMDIIIGRSNDQLLRYYRNDGSPGNFSFVLVSSNLLNNFCRPGDGNSWCNPELADIDGDNDLDILVANYNGFVRFWRNDGTPSIAIWSDQGDLGGIGQWCCSLGLSVADLDKDNDLDVVLGDYNNRIVYYKNIGSRTNYNFIYIYAGDGGYSFLPVSGNYPKPEIADLNGDNKPDIMQGNDNGFTTASYNNGFWQTAIDKANNPTWIHEDGDLFNARCDPEEGTGYCNGDLVDMDNDGDLDVIGGNYYYGPRFWENVGNKQSYSFVARGRIASDFGNFHHVTTGDFDNDGDYDAMIGYDDGRTHYFKNVGTRTSPSFVDVYRGYNGDNYLPEIGDYARPASVDINGDGLVDLLFTVSIPGQGGYNSDVYFLRNRGFYTDDRMRASDPSWISDGSILDTGRPYNKASPADIDGDGDIDLIVGDDLNRLLYYRNDGTPTSDRYTLNSVLVDFGSDWGRPAVVDIDGDGDFDILSGQGSGTVNEIKNTGNYNTATTITLMNSGGLAVQNALVVFSDDSGVVCSNLTNSIGQVRCPITFNGNKGKITVSNGTAGNVVLGILSPNSKGNVFMAIANPSSSFSVDLERFAFQTFDLRQNPNSMRIKVSDDGVDVFSRSTSNGFIDGFFPKKYLENRQEPFTQNRIQYDIVLEGNSEYTSDLLLDGIFVPNEINFNGNNEGSKLYKLLSTHQMSTDAEYKGFILYPALSAQRNYALIDHVPSNFTYKGQAITNYLGKFSCSKPSNGTQLTINLTTPGCEFLSNPVPTSGDWLKYQFIVRTPSLDQFISEGLSTKDYNFPQAELTLIS